MSTTMFGICKETGENGAIYKEDLEIPQIGERDILVRVRATAICGTDLHIMEWTPYAQNRCKLPMVFGHEMSGDVVEVGALVTEVRVGDRVACETHIPCNHCYQCQTNNRHICENMKIIGVHTPGSFAEYISFPVDCAYKIGDDISYETGAMLEPMGVAAHGMEVANVQGKTIAIYGCGAIGLMAVGIAHTYSAKKIYAIDLFEAKLSAALDMGADVVINVKEEKAVQRVLSETQGVGVDVVIDFTGSQKAINDGFSILRKGGTFVMVGLPENDLIVPATDNIIYKEATVVGVTGRRMYETWDQCQSALSSPRYNIQRTIGGIYPLKDFEKAFTAIRNGVPGKMILIP